MPLVLPFALPPSAFASIFWKGWYPVLVSNPRGSNLAFVTSPRLQQDDKNPTRVTGGSRIRGAGRDARGKSRSIGGRGDKLRQQNEPSAAFSWTGENSVSQ
ncbi:hypothetical protein K432DRAFT_384150 [Lepidopterella palustris CBS 459.81]|uniref:Uncharacterized protein n=1 Tax=Lepidopterella palustris CBS 459.81 TaxID=1314670 RepID=A0A8E2JDI5_9PEZI|nr:hypothetical protein K432DRAFT_384150 [Lepidopterella palustris CBS 459.81]